MKKISILTLFLISALASAEVYRAAFQEDFLRYPPPDVLMNQLRMNFPLIQFSEDEIQECQILTKKNRPLLGDNNAATGTPITPQPNSGFIVWYKGCLSQLLNREFEVVESLEKNEKSSDLEINFSSVVLLKCQKQGLQFCKWKNLPEDLKLTAIAELVETHIGPDEILNDLGIAATVNDFSKIILSEIQDYETRRDDRYQFLIPKTGPDLTVYRALQISKYLILMTDSFRY